MEIKYLDYFSSIIWIKRGIHSFI